MYEVASAIIICAQSRLHTRPLTARVRQQVGHWDPITKAPCNPSAAVRNLGLRAATQQYLDEHPWAYGEIC